jgi:hypothetical protein
MGRKREMVRERKKKKETLNVGEEKVSFYQFPEILKKQL